MNDNDKYNQNDDMSDNLLQRSVVDSLIKRYEDKKNTSYLASSKELANSSTELLSVEQIFSIFKEKSKYYSNIKKS